MLAASLLLWDILWEVKVPAYKEEPWVVELQHIKRAHRLMSVLDGVREAFRTNEVPAAGGGGEAAPKATEDADEDIPGCPRVAGTTSTEIARRMLAKAAPTGVPGEYKASTLS
eukprot:13824321-Alexandrium_andersonii.AAC.1